MDTTTTTAAAADRRSGESPHAARADVAAQHNDARPRPAQPRSGHHRCPNRRSTRRDHHVDTTTEDVDASESDAPNDGLRLLVIFVLALVTIGAVAAGGPSHRQGSSATTEPAEPPWCAGLDAEACGRWDPPVDPR